MVATVYKGIIEDNCSCGKECAAFDMIDVDNEVIDVDNDVDTCFFCDLCEREHEECKMCIKKRTETLDNDEECEMCTDMRKQALFWADYN